MDKKIKDLLDEFYKDTWKPVPVIEYLPEETLISKKYQFIERLITGNKIEFWKIKTVYYEDNIYGTHGVTYHYSKYSNLDNLLMILAIQDKPLDFLITVLKD